MKTTTLTLAALSASGLLVAALLFSGCGAYRAAVPEDAFRGLEGRPAREAVELLGPPAGQGRTEATLRWRHRVRNGVGVWGWAYAHVDRKTGKVVATLLMDD